VCVCFCFCVVLCVCFLVSCVMGSCPSNRQAQAVLAALQHGDVEAAHARSLVSAQMSVATYRKVIVDGEDYRPLSVPGARGEWVGEPQMVARDEAKIRLRLHYGDGDGERTDLNSAPPTEYDFRMVAPVDGDGATDWVVKAVSRL
jgi:hypothetical protein